MRSLVIALCALCACRQSAPPIRPAAIIGVPEAGTPCATACAKIVANHCDGLTDASACALACARDQAQGAASQLDPQCVIDAGTLSAIQACRVCLTQGGP